MSCSPDSRIDQSRTGVVLLGSGDFSVAPFEALRARAAEIGIEIRLVVSQPDRPAGRGRIEQPTPVSRWAAAHGLAVIRPANVNAPEVLEKIRSLRAGLFVVVAFGQKLSPELLHGVGAINLHGSLLPAWRGAAPIQRSLMAGDAKVGVSVIEVGERMDAGGIFATAETTLIQGETAGELHDRLSLLGVEPLVKVVAQWIGGARGTRAQDESLVTRARKLSRADAWVDFTRPASEVSARINGLSPWPGVDAMIAGHSVRILRARIAQPLAPTCEGRIASVGEIASDGSVGCGSGAVELLEVQAPGSRAVTLASFLNGRRLAAGARVESPAKPTEGGGQA
ncbi:MAG: methionyl-tRNA formyltransferase [Phycisphaerales bacterium]|nr:methionyl-tRNA formyltransferase [Phycisphaerales bacterium]